MDKSDTPDRLRGTCLHRDCFCTRLLFLRLCGLFRLHRRFFTPAAGAGKSAARRGIAMRRGKRKNRRPAGYWIFIRRTRGWR